MDENLAWLTEKTEESKCNKEGGGQLCGERPDKYFLLSAWHRELYEPGVRFLLFDRHEYTDTESSDL